MTDLVGGLVRILQTARHSEFRVATGSLGLGRFQELRKLDKEGRLMIGAGISYSSLSAPERSALCRKAGRCEICGSATRTLALDHDHNTDQVRGVLCFVCNLALVYHIERGTIPKVPEELVLVAFAYLDATSWQSVMALPNGTVRVIR